MPKIEIAGRPRAALCLTTLVLLSAPLAACGGSSSSAGSKSAGASPSPSSATGPAGSSGTSSAAPAKTTTSGTTAGKTTTTPVTKAPAGAAKRLRAHTPTTTPPHGGTSSLRSAVTRFAECLRQNGLKIPKPSTNGKGPVLPTAGLNTNTPQFRKAATKCRSVLLAGLRQSRPKVGAR